MHNIEHYNYPITANKNEILAELSTMVEHETWREGGAGIRAIRWNDFVCQNYEEAEKWIESHDKGFYDQLAVKYWSPMPFRNEKTKELSQKIDEANKEYYAKNAELYPKTRTSEFIGCGMCKSKLATKHVKSNFCPVCGKDLRPETNLKRIAAAKTKLENARKKYNEYIDKHAKKELRWLVKIEYHT